MNNKKLLMLLAIPLLVSSVSGCGNKTSDPLSGSDRPINTDEVSSSKDESWSFTQVIEDRDLLPSDVANANVEIDLVMYIEGQNGTMPDIGNYTPDPNDPSRKYHPADVSSIEMAKFVGAAAAFKKLCPGVKINLMYCTSSEYESLVREYNNQKGHLPHLMHSTTTVWEMMSAGYLNDLSVYSDTEYYQQYNEFLLSRFNYGGFQGAVPFAMYPWGIFVNMDSLEKYNVVSDTIDGESLECTDEYKQWVENFTWASFMDACRKSNTETHAGMSKMYSDIASYSIASIYPSFVSEGKVDLSSSEVISTMSKVLEYENELAKLCVYDYSDVSLSYNPTKKEYFSNAASWRGVENFVKDQYSTFMAEAPWSLPTISQYVASNNEKALTDSSVAPIDIHVDYLPYPKVDEDSTAYSGVGVSAMAAGNLCPVGDKDGLEHCYSSTAKLEMEVAAYFAMFMGLDPRAIESRSQVRYIHDNKEYVGDLSLPLAKRNAKFNWQIDEAYADIEDPAEDYDDNWQYQLALWLDLYNIYKTNDEPADVRYFSNVPYGLLTLLDSVYMLDGIGDDYVTALNPTNEPVNVPDGGDIKDIFLKWKERYTTFANPDTNDGVLGTSGYVSAVMSNLSDLEEDINSNADIAWGFLQESVDLYYFDSKFNPIYNVLDKSYRNNYEGSMYVE